MHKKLWVKKELPDQKVVQELMESVKVDKNIATLLAQRGISNYKEAKSFFRPDFNDLHNPFLMKDMREAVNRINRAIANNEKILVYGDYDVDGTTSVALMYTFLRETLNYRNVSFYIPDRYKEGYGVSTEGILFAADNGFDLIISLDCGIKSVDKVALAKEKGIDFIICDHHLPGEELPDAVAILNPKQKACSYPYDELSGCGVGFKLIQAVGKELQINEEKIYPFLDLVVVSIGADIVPITGENRVLASLGLDKINTNPRPGLKKMIFEKFPSKKNLTHFDLEIEDIVFGIAPTINAAGRIGHAHDSVNLLINTDDVYLDSQYKHLKVQNDIRQKIGEDMINEIFRMFESDPTFKEKNTTVVYNPNWSKGVVGIVASKIIESFHYRPTIVFGNHEGKITGSARSIPGFDIHEAIESCADILENYGGHKYAAGLTIKEENMDDFQTRFEKAVTQKITEQQKIPIVEIDLELEFKDISDKFMRILKQFRPFGPGNMNPIFSSRNIFYKNSPQLLKNQHIKFYASQDNYPKDFSTIAFKMPHIYEKLLTVDKFSIAYTLKQNVWNSNIYTNIEIKDFDF